METVRVEQPVPGGRARGRRPLLLLGLLFASLLISHSASSAVDVQHRLRLVTDQQQSEDHSGPAASTPASALTTTSLAAADWSTDSIPATSDPTDSTDASEQTPTITVPTGSEVTPPTALVATDTPPVPPPVGPGTKDPALVSRPIPTNPPAPPTPAPSPYAGDSGTTGAGYVATKLGCASGTSAGALDAFFRDRIGPVLGGDYQHVYSLGGGRNLWLFQDTFLDYTGAATTLGKADFVHNVAMVQDGACFTLYHRGSMANPGSFEQGTGENRLAKWFWPLGGETSNGQLTVFWAQMQKDGYDPSPPNGLGWHPVAVWIAVYDTHSLARLAFHPAANAGTYPMYGYAVASDSDYTYLFGNTFEQNLQREGGYYNGPHSGTMMFLARVPKGNYGAAPEYRTATDWSPNPGDAIPISQRYWVENPMQPRYLNGEWVSATKVDGYWGDQVAIDVANNPWGPWTNVDTRGIAPRGGDPKMNTYQAHLMPWLSGGALVVSISENARNMARDAWPNPARYRPSFFSEALIAPPPDPTTTTSTSVDETSTTIVDSTTSSTTPATDGATTTIGAPSTTSTSIATTTTPVATTTTSTSPTTTAPVTTTTSPATTVPATTTTVAVTTTTTSTTPDTSG